MGRVRPGLCGGGGGWVAVEGGIGSDGGVKMHRTSIMSCSFTFL